MFAERIERIFGAVDARLAGMPRWARPPFYGMLLVFAMMVIRRGALLIPVVILGILLGGPEAAIQIAWILIVAGLAGFVGGLAYALAHPVLGRLGRAGHIATGWLAVFAYLTTAVFLLGSADPDLRARLDLQQPISWIIICPLSLLFGTVLGWMLHAEGPGQKRESRRRVPRRQRVTSRVHPPPP